MSEKIYEVPAEWKSRAFVDEAKYETMYAQSINDPNAFWGEQGKRIHWTKPFTKVKNTSYDPHHVSIKWFEDGETNVSYNCVDRHLAKWKNKAALIFVPEPEDESHIVITFQELYRRVNEVAAMLRDFAGLQKGDRVTIHMPMIPELPITMLACARLGVIHSVVFGGFSGEACGLRAADSGSRVLIYADGYHRNGRWVDHKASADIAVDTAQEALVSDKVFGAIFGTAIATVTFGWLALLGYVGWKFVDALW